MAHPVTFEGKNTVMRAPAGAENVQDMHVYRTRHSCVSCWLFTAEELAEINHTGRAFLSVLMSGEQPPVYVGSEITCREVMVDFGPVWPMAARTPSPQTDVRGATDAYMRLITLFDQDATAASFLSEDGDGGFVGGVYRMAREIETLRIGIKRLSDEEELCGETMPEEDAFNLVRMAAKLAATEAKNERLTKMLAGCDWYWPEDDTSSDACADGTWQIVENNDVKPGEVFGYSRGGIVETRYYGYLEAADDSDSDDQFEADEPTRAAAEAKIAAELQRRAALAATEEIR